MFELLKTEGKARRGRMTTVHGVIETPVFMNVGTSAAVKGAFPPVTLRRSAVRSSFPIPTTSTSVRGMS